MAGRFCPEGADAAVERHMNGTIHDTWFVTTRYGSFVLQRLNDQIFVDCVLVMENLMRVVLHLQKRVTKSRLSQPDRRVLWPLRAEGGLTLVYDDDGRPWRAFRRVERAVSTTVVRTPDQAFQIGRGIGRFFVDIQDLPGRRLPEPIPGFKDFERRRQDFELVVEADPFDRAAGCGPEIGAVRSHRRVVKQLAAAKAAGRLRERVVHNDAKASNVLLCEDSGEALCVVDLDTVGTGNVLHDVGDLLRSSTVTLPEDVTDRGSLGVRDDLLQAALAGYLREAGLVLSAEELELLPLAGPLMAYESALRFLTDYLLGDVYFRTDHPRHNLERTRAQLRVLDALTKASDRVAEIVRRESQ